ncbi:hypothetical protein ACWGOQ_0022210 [Aquimarina sp. M1]
MRTLRNNIRTILLVVLMASAFNGYTQKNLYKTQLEPVYLKNTIDVVYKNTFSDYNTNLIALKKINFKKEIKSLNKANNTLLFVSNKNSIKLIAASYLKIIRKAANRSRNPEDFQAFLTNNLPQLSLLFSTDNNLDELYYISRKDTFNGKIDALPSIL